MGGFRRPKLGGHAPILPNNRSISLRHIISLVAKASVALPVEHPSGLAYCYFACPYHLFLGSGGGGGGMGPTCGVSPPMPGSMYILLLLSIIIIFIKVHSVYIFRCFLVQESMLFFADFPKKLIHQ